MRGRVCFYINWKCFSEMMIGRWAGNYAFQKRAFDILVSCGLLVVLAPICVGLLVLNQFLNRGPLFFFQDRMGKNCQRFTTWKFRSMTVHESVFENVPGERDASTGTRGARSSGQPSRHTFGSYAAQNPN